MRKLIAILLMGLCLTACEKEISMDYHRAETRYVVEAHINTEGTEVRVSTTNAMDDNTIRSEVDNAVVRITVEDGTVVDIPFIRNGYYRSALKGVPGTEYHLDVEVDGHHFSSTSTMQRVPKMNTFKLVWKKMLTERYLFGDLRLQDIPNETNYYFMHIYRDGGDLGYRWAVMKDDTNPNKELQQLFTFFRKGEHGSDVLVEGERLRVVVRAIDERAYDYLYSMQQMENTNTNPIDNFTGGCLGYFSAYSEIAFYQDFYYNDVVEDEEK